MLVPYPNCIFPCHSKCYCHLIILRQLNFLCPLFTPFHFPSSPAAKPVDSASILNPRPLPLFTGRLYNPGQHHLLSRPLQQPPNWVPSPAALFLLSFCHENNHNQTSSLLPFLWFPDFLGGSPAWSGPSCLFSNFISCCSLPPTVSWWPLSYFTFLSTNQALFSLRVLAVFSSNSSLFFYL